MAAQSAALSAQRLVSRTGEPQRGRLRKTTIVALARKLLVAL